MLRRGGQWGEQRSKGVGGVAATATVVVVVAVVVAIEAIDSYTSNSQLDGQAAAHADA